MPSLQPFNQTKRVYPTLPAGTHPDIVRAFNDLHDNQYELRSQIQKMQADKIQAPASVKPSFNDNIQGIKIKGLTAPGIPPTGSVPHPDTTALSNGDTIRYNATTGQFEFGA